MRRCCLGPTSRATAKFADELDNIMGRDLVEVSDLITKVERHEAIKETNAVIDRRVCQAALVAEVALVLGLQPIQWCQRLLLWLWTIGNTGLDERVDEAFQAVALLIVLVRMHRLERGGVRR